jgi:hypothetical protein
MGINSRKKCQTTLNVESSRSHSVFTLKLYEKNLETNEIEFLEKYAIVDLAGSERNKRTNTQSDDLKDASYINKSLCILGRCLNDIQWNQRHNEQNQRIVPFRESKLTRIFQDLMEKGKVVMCVHANPSIDDMDETCAVLKYSALAKQIETGCRYNQATPKSKRQLFQSPKLKPETKERETKEREIKETRNFEKEMIEMKEKYERELKEKEIDYLNVIKNLELKAFRLEETVNLLERENVLLANKKHQIESTCEKLMKKNQQKETEISELQHFIDMEQKRIKQEADQLEREFQIELFETNCSHQATLTQKDEELIELKLKLENNSMEITPKKKKILQNLPMNLLTPREGENESLYDKWSLNQRNKSRNQSQFVSPVKTKSPKFIKSPMVNKENQKSQTSQRLFK